MKKENLIIIFYVIYFSWLFTVVYLTPSKNILNYFAIGVALFYFIFLREKRDIIWFWIAAFIPIIIGAFSFNRWQIKFDTSVLTYIPIWLPLAWGTTIVALRKFFIIMSG